ncbi:MAG: RHS repeat domain-containing protein, partial [Parachlamydiaceae bacterium]
WIESSTDYETAGPHPLILKRLFCSSIDHSDHLTPEWKFSLPHFNHGGIPVLDHDGFKYIYNSKRELVKAENRFGQSVKIERPRPGLIELVTSHGRKIEYQFEKISNHNCLKRVKRPGNADRIYDYKEIKGSILLKKRDETDGRYLLWEHDNTGRVIKTLAPAGTTSEPKTLMSIRYFDKKTEVLNPYGYKKLYSYQDDYRINKIEHFLGDSVFKSEEMKWDNGLLLSHKIYDQNGRLIAARSLDYDEYGRLTRETWEGNITGKGNDKATRHLRYDPEGRLVYEEEEDGKTTFYKWDNHLLVYKKEGSIETFYAYNDLGLPIEERICEQDQELVTRITEYNRFGLPEKISRFSNGVWLDNKIYAYSNEGWVSSETTEKESGLTSQFYERDVSGRILSSANEKGEIEFFEYDKHGNLIRHDSLLETKVMRYDFMNWLISEEGKTAFTYDLCGNTLTKADEYGNITAFKYDAIGRIIEINAPLVNTPEGPKQPTTYFEYDCFDRIIKKIEPRGDTTYTKYNLRGQPIEIIYPDQTIETFEYSKSGRLLKKTLRNGLIQTFEYDANGRMIHFQEFNHDVLKKEKYLSYKLDKVVQEKSFETEINSFYLPDGTLERVLVNTPERQFILDCKKEIKEPADAHFQSRLIESERINELGQWVKETTYTSESGLKVVKVYDA